MLFEKGARHDPDDPQTNLHRQKPASAPGAIGRDLGRQRGRGVIRQAIEREATSGLAQRLAPDATALEELIQAALQCRAAGITGQPLRWRREDAYAERLDHYERQGAQEEGI